MIGLWQFTELSALFQSKWPFIVGWEDLPLVGTWGEREREWTDIEMIGFYAFWFYILIVRISHLWIVEAGNYNTDSFYCGVPYSWSDYLFLSAFFFFFFILAVSLVFFFFIIFLGYSSYMWKILEAHKVLIMIPAIRWLKCCTKKFNIK